MSPSATHPHPDPSHIIMKALILIALSAIAYSLSSCTGYSIALRTPYGDASSKDGGPLNVRLKPFVLPEK